MDEFEPRCAIIKNDEHGSKFTPDYYKYRNGDDVFSIADYFGLDFPLGNALKYLLRAGHKAGEKKSDDLNKAIKCIIREIELEMSKIDK